MAFAAGNAKRKCSYATSKGGSWLSTEGRTNGERKGHDQQLLPGIPDDLTLTRISPKLSSSVLNILTVVSHGWLRAIQSHEVFEARRFFGTEQTAFVFVNGVTKRSEVLRLALYSVEDNSVCYLPRIPSFTPNSTIHAFTYTSFGGKLYVMASLKDENRMVCNRLTYVYDLVGHIGWKRCADPKFVSEPNESAVMNAKIFVCGPLHGSWQCSLLECATYDPDNDIWSPMTLIHSNFDHLRNLFVTGNAMHEHFFHCDRVRTIATRPYFHRFIQWIGNWMVQLDGSTRLNDIVPIFPSSTEEIKSGEGIEMTMMCGRFLKATQEGVDIYDSHTNTWAPLHSGSPLHMKDINSLFRFNLSERARGIDVAVVGNTVFSLEVLLGYRNTFQLHLWGREVLVRDINHPEVPKKAEYDHGLRRSVTFEGNYQHKELLRCPVQL